MNQIFDIRRTLDFARYKFGLNRKLLMLSFLGYFALIFIISFFIAYYADSPSTQVFDYFHLVTMGIMLFLGTVFIAGKAFSDMNSSEKSIGMIMIPASTFEKFILPLLFSSIGWMLTVYVSYELFALLVNGLWSALFSMDFVFFNPFDFIDGKRTTDLILAYFLTHSVFFLGAAAFRKYPIAKTILAQFLLNFAYSMLSLLFIMIIFGNLQDFGHASENFGDLLYEKGWLTKENIVYYARVLKMLTMVVLPLLLYVTAFFKFKEREV